jgi:hypothetical protein
VGLDSTTQTVLFPEIFSKPVVARLDQEDSSSDGGAVLLQAADRRLGLSEALAECLRDPRQPGKLTHTRLELLRQRIFGIALGYPDANDAQGLAEDPMAETLADVVIERHRKRLQGRRVRLITLDFDPTDDPTHGQQEFTFFHGYYDTYCYLPLLGTMAFNGEKEQYLVCAMLRPGNSAAHVGLIAVLRRVLERLWAAFPKARIRVRLDGGFGAPHVLDFLDDNGVEYVVGLSATKPLKKRARRTLGTARRLFRERGKTVPLYAETLHKTKTTWPHRRRVIFKAEVVQLPGREPKDNVRFVVTNLRSSPQHVYGIYTDRGDAENRIKELKNDLAIDRTSCSRFLANQLRVLLTAAAYVLMQELRLRGRHTDCAHAQVGTLRLRLLKLAAWVEVSVRRVVVHLPRAFPADASWLRIAGQLGAVPP